MNPDDLHKHPNLADAVAAIDKMVSGGWHCSLTFSREKRVYSAVAHPPWSQMGTDFNAPDLHYSSDPFEAIQMAVWQVVTGEPHPFVMFLSKKFAAVDKMREFGLEPRESKT